MRDDYTFIDCDGVIIDSEQRMLKRKEEMGFLNHKVQDLRENRHIYSPIIFVPPGIQKYEVVIPNNQLLIDDSKKNINGWIEHDGQGLLFDDKLDNNSKTKVRSLKFLLKR